MAPAFNPDGSIKWTYGVAIWNTFWRELELLTDDGRKLHMAPHVIEKA